MRKKSLIGKTVLITGSAVRIGREIALALAREGMNVIVHYNTSDRQALEVCDAVRGIGPNAWAVNADFREPLQFDTFIRRAAEMAGGLDLLVNNASIFPKTTLDELTIEEIFTNIEINAWAPFALSRSFAREVRQGGIINLIDQRITSYDWNHTGYILSKHVLSVLTRMSALAFAPNITVNGIAPGLILPPPGEPMSYLEKLTNTVPLKRHGDPQDIADAAVFLAMSTFITGEVIFVDGGRHLKEYE